MNRDVIILGTYPKWLAYPLRWMLKKKLNNARYEIRFIGRGSTKKATRRQYPYGLPVSKANKVALVISTKYAYIEKQKNKSYKQLARVA